MKVISLKARTIKEVSKSMQAIGVDPRGIKIMAPKGVFYLCKVEGISSVAANIIKQHLLSLGSDAAISRDALVKNIKTSLVVFGTFHQIKKLADKLKGQPFELSELAFELKSFLKSSREKSYLFRARGRVLRIAKPVLCGIINVTTDSFSGDGLLNPAKYNSSKTINLALKRVENMIRGGARIIDIGGESTRPYSKPVRDREELKRVVPVISAVRKKFPNIFISVDTSKYKIAKEAVNSGVDIINDITALEASPKTALLIAKYKLGCILMHMKGNPKTMQVKPEYDDLMGDILEFLGSRVEFCQKRGISKEQLMVDPGIGFGKTVSDNFKILNRARDLKTLGVPVFLGVSRKSFIGKSLNANIEGRLIGTVAAIVCGYLNGVDVFRVHDVKEAQQALKIAYEVANARV